MEDISVVVGLIVGIAGWFLLARFMKINGRSWWLRHLAGALLVVFPTVGFSLIFGGLVGATDDTGAPIGFAGALGGLIFSLPMLISLWLSWRKSKRLNAIDKATSEKAKPDPVVLSQKAKSKPAETLEQTLENNRQSVRASIQQRSGRRSTARLAPSPAPISDNLSFVYEDSQGNITTREVSNWRESDDYLKGYCHKAGEIRTFRRDRIVEFLCGGDLLSPIVLMPPQRKQTVEAIEILFTGFTKVRRAQLEATANEFGMRVCKTVTVGLSFICAGPTAGPTKLRNAQAKGVSVLDETDFLKLLETGEMPE